MALRATYEYIASDAESGYGRGFSSPPPQKSRTRSSGHAET
jgi:hypothetical protein